jgi:hypothetical protein
MAGAAILKSLFTVSDPYNHQGLSNPYYFQADLIWCDCTFIESFGFCRAMYSLVIRKGKDSKELGETYQHAMIMTVCRLSHPCVGHEH